MRKIAVTSGDPAGVGPEVIYNWATRNQDKENHICVIGPVQLCQKLQSLGEWECIPLGDSMDEVVLGQPNERGSALAFEALEVSAKGCLDGIYKSVVTCPISKFWMKKVGFDFEGHTEFFADRWNGVPSMGFIGEKMRVVLATWHIPLASVSSCLNRDVIARAIRRSYEMLSLIGIENPKIAVCGLNPHAGESGILGSEELDLIDPVLNEFRDEFPGLSKALPGDTVFWRHLRGDFDSVIAMYHDQGLAPLKTLEFDKAVNITLGLKYIRTSPDHGTGYDIAGKNISSCESFSRAVAIADLKVRK